MTAPPRRIRRTSSSRSGAATSPACAAIGLAASPSTSASRAPTSGSRTTAPTAGGPSRAPAPTGPAASRRRTSIRWTATGSCPGSTPMHIGGDNWSADAAIRFIENEPDWHGLHGQPRRDRQARAHVGARGRGGARRRSRVRGGDAPPAVHREERGRAGREDRRRAEDQRAARRHADRDHGRPRGA